MEKERKKCSRCGVEHPLHFFRKTRKKSMHGSTHTQYRLSICKACESKERIEKKNTDPFLLKARSTITHHAERQGVTFRGFLQQFDLTIGYIVMLFEREWKLHELGYGCLNCAKPMADMLNDFTLDLINPKRLPTRSNLRVICRTCNVEKGRKDPTEFDLECAQYRHNEEAIKVGVQFDLPESKTPKVSKPRILKQLQPSLF